MTILEKLQNKLSDLYYDISFLKRKDVSWRFKILNVLSGDRLRLAIAIPCMQLDSLIEQHNDIYEFKEKYSADPNDVVEYYKGLDWKMGSLKKDLLDIWQI